MDTRILQTFLLVAESGGLSSAASILGVPQSQVSRHVKELEEACGAPLLYRHGRGVRLTLAGETLKATLAPLLLLEELGTARVVLAASRDFPLSPSDRVPPDLAGVPLRLPSSGQGLRRQIDLWAARHGLNLNVAYEIDDIDMTREIIAAGRAAAIVSRLSVHRELAEGTFVERSLGEDFKARTVLATARNRPITPAMKATIQTLKAVAAPLFEAIG